MWRRQHTQLDLKGLSVPSPIPEQDETQHSSSAAVAAGVLAAGSTESRQNTPVTPFRGLRFLQNTPPKNATTFNLFGDVTKENGDEKVVQPFSSLSAALVIEDQDKKPPPVPIRTTSLRGSSTPLNQYYCGFGSFIDNQAKDNDVNRPPKRARLAGMDNDEDDGCMKCQKWTVERERLHQKIASLEDELCVSRRDNHVMTKLQEENGYLCRKLEEKTHGSGMNGDGVTGMVFLQHEKCVSAQNEEIMDEKGDFGGNLPETNDTKQEEDIAELVSLREKRDFFVHELAKFRDVFDGCVKTTKDVNETLEKCAEKMEKWKEAASKYL